MVQDYFVTALLDSVICIFFFPVQLYLKFRMKPLLLEDGISFNFIFKITLKPTTKFSELK